MTRAYLEMDLHISRVTKSLSNFLEEDLSATYLGLGQGARAHLERFRSFLNSFYIDKFGYWPPPKGATFSKALYRSMYSDFRGLYEYLADPASTNDICQQPPATGGICVLQNVQAFDERHKYEPLPHPLCLIPDVPRAHHRRDSQRGLLTLKLGTKDAKRDLYMSTRNSLTAASNVKVVTPGRSALIRSFMKFERDWSSTRQEERVSLTDARKVRWLLIYGVLQKLISIIRAPPEVRNTDDPTYPLCCLMIGVPPWKEVQQRTRDVLKSTKRLSSSANSAHIGERVVSPTPRSPSLSIHPDCDEDYFGHPRGASLHRADSLTIPAPLRIPAKENNIARHSSMRQFKNLAFSPFSSRRNSTDTRCHSIVSRRVSAANRLSNPQFCEIMVQGYGNGLNQAPLGPGSKRSSLVPSVMDRLHADNASLLSTRRPPRTPTLETFQLDPFHNLASPIDTGDATSPPPSPIWSSEESAPSSRTDSIIEQLTNNTTPSTSICPPAGHGRVWVPESPGKDKNLDRMTIGTDMTRASYYRPQSCDSMTPSIRIGSSKVDIYSAVRLLRRTMPIYEDVAESIAPSRSSTLPEPEELPTLQELKLELDERLLHADRKSSGRKMIRSSMDIFNAIKVGSMNMWHDGSD